MLRRLAPIVPIACAVLFAAPASAQRAADYHYEKSLNAGSEVSVHNINGDIKVVASTSGKVEVIGTKFGDARDRDFIKAVVQETSRGIVICVVDDNADSYCDDDGVHMHSRGNRDWDHGGMNLSVAVPTNLVVNASSVSGNVAISGAHGDVSGGTVSGDVHMDHLHATSVRANSVSGNVDVRIDELTGRGDLTFHSVSGDISLEVPQGFAADLSMSTVSGDVDSDFPMTLGGSNRLSRRSLEAKIGGGGRRLDVKTVSGDLRLRPIK
jgi:DUF4097 and DUF4098 domain-containing protein YvlB